MVNHPISQLFVYDNLYLHDINPHQDLRLRLAVLQDDVSACLSFFQQQPC